MEVVNRRRFMTVKNFYDVYVGGQRNRVLRHSKSDLTTWSNETRD